MIIHTTILEKTGDVNGIYNVFTSKEEITNEEIIESLRFDNEEHMYSKHMLDKNPSKDSSEINFNSNAVHYRQELAATKLPYRIQPTVDLIDSFVCLGSRFGLQPLNVFVEIYQSTDNNKIWAKIFYVADSEIPACIIRTKRYLQYIK